MGTGDDVVLVAVEPGKRRLRGGERLRFAVRAAELGDLLALGRIAVGERRIEVVDPQRVEDRRLNNVLHSLGTADPAPTLAEWLRATPGALTYEYLSRLEDRKLVRVRRWRDRGGRSHHDILYVDVARRREVLDRLDGPDGDGGDAGRGSPLLAALVQAAGLAPVAYPGLRGRAARRRLAARTEAAGTLSSAIGGAAGAVDMEKAASAAKGIDTFSRRLFGELTTLYADFGTAGHGLGHDLNAGSWTSADPSGSHHHGGHHGGGHHGDGGGDGHGGW